MKVIHRHPLHSSEEAYQQKLARMFRAALRKLRERTVSH